ncbi:hypothetical protein TREMEDRAFT_65658 [Tremella mesenterica DSM 1558]|uniref:uncharacterized protein n=1 Tax=Tremella mesenterica (strain ATCC 24925 / CBS 8224 / DSM 1558 / NBRC 9311 / NRRL Y-6157 / RJB 2259-6 / UBC 559-6) TaxID=578456 RepID=UPI00032BC385|nr:uncharacterized protein TREMEDRAFT_65658 [Tremella mesenterica DSM 1558]EIW66376.1 hypothetical protein TREMEDRAFT_65658 [Tremella mesenterica DSM 1558]
MASKQEDGMTQGTSEFSPAPSTWYLRPPGETPADARKDKHPDISQHKHKGEEWEESESFADWILRICKEIPRHQARSRVERTLRGADSWYRGLTAGSHTDGPREMANKSSDSLIRAKFSALGEAQGATVYAWMKTNTAYLAVIGKTDLKMNESLINLLLASCPSPANSGQSPTIYIASREPSFSVGSSLGGGETGVSSKQVEGYWKDADLVLSLPGQGEATRALLPIEDQWTEADVKRLVRQEEWRQLELEWLTSVRKTVVTLASKSPGLIVHVSEGRPSHLYGKEIMYHSVTFVHSSNIPQETLAKSRHE